MEAGQSIDLERNIGITAIVRQDPSLNVTSGQLRCQVAGHVGDTAVAKKSRYDRTDLHPTRYQRSSLNC